MFSGQLPDLVGELSELERSAESAEFPKLSSLSDWRSAAAFIWNLGKASAQDRDSIRRASEKGKFARFGGKVFALSPLYVTSYCAEHCVYCNFRAGNKRRAITRRRLSDSELLEEVDFLALKEGIRTIELVYATDPFVRISDICRQVELVRRRLDLYGGGEVGLNAEAFDEKDYRSLRAAGLGFVVLWQEVYDRHAYTALHPGSTKKTDYGYRVNAYERMISAGITVFGMGILSGLADWRREWMMLLAHEEYLRNTYGVGPRILGIPRLKAAEGALMQHAESQLSDEDFSAVIALHNLVFPDVLPFVNTRESWKMCIDLAGGGGCLFTFNCSTIPGGYSLSTPGYQFPTLSFDATLWQERMMEEGLSPIMMWESSTLQRELTS